MQHAEFVAEIEKQSSALRTAAVSAGPDAPVPTCPRWTVSRLVGHLGRVQSWVRKALADPTGADTDPGRPPEDWETLLAWFDEQRTGLVAELSDPEKPAWLPFPRYPKVAASWARRQAHEAAIHRLDAEHALAPEPEVSYGAEFAADGVDELIAFMVPGRRDWTKTSATGSVVLYATDVQRGWRVDLAPGVPPEIRPGEGSGDLTITGTADQVYRRVWARPSEATVVGDTELLEPIASP
ncbi:maleylpyruvate isomerase family mycothiol-dependent enzyme [Amycolatopsis acidicola]|uniref:Maleylpyruvate isomerase family mycothiol-dependent enzyme n=1 Tax=Amycolatopsis acidicola TaxID=2596893 RepID=A0A5N0VF02_9PSEU|nr:maleylpyruvate isomerase family mycothiol-dependent enzyme [Amycolatopsis acidicola]KAA9164896.1 maleylpyruvate isomerase family mycothiol-dependent enzyme [Amycolatopsis acidicola]